MSTKWVAPTVHQGDIVLWYDAKTPTTKPWPALVIDVYGNGLIDLLAFQANAFNGTPRSAVHHADDPDKRAIEISTDGVWTHKPALVKEGVMTPLAKGK